MPDSQKKNAKAEEMHYHIKTQNCLAHSVVQLDANMPISDHCNGERFYNHVARPERMSGKGIAEWLIKRRFRNSGFQKAQWFSQPATSHPMDVQQAADSLGSEHTQPVWQACFIGHATVLLQIGEFHFLTDPVWCDYVSPMQGMGPKRFRDMGMALEQLPKIDAVLLSHNHYDHMDLATLNWLVEHFNMPIYTGLRNAQYLPNHFNVIEMDWWQTESFGNEQQFKIAYVPAQHGSGRGLRDQNQALWGGFSLLHPSGHAYFAGDAAYSDYFKQIYAKYGAPRLALLPIGAYEPRHLMQYVHMNPDDAVKAHQDLHSHLSLAIHHRMFQLTDESMFAPAEDLAVALDAHEVASNQFICLEEGQRIDPAPVDQ